MSAPGLVEKLRGQECPLSTQFLRALSLCHTVMAQQDKGWLFVSVVIDCSSDYSMFVFRPKPHPPRSWLEVDVTRPLASLWVLAAAVKRGVNEMFIDILSALLQRLWFTRLHPQTRRLWLVLPGSSAGSFYPGPETWSLSLSWGWLASISSWLCSTSPASGGACPCWVRRNRLSQIGFCTVIMYKYKDMQRYLINHNLLGAHHVLSLLL